MRRIWKDYNEVAFRGRHGEEKLRAHAALDALFGQIAVQCREIEPAVMHSKRVRYNIVNLFPLIYNFLSF